MKTQCSKTVLAGENGCRVIYCHHCQVAEIEIGSVSLRLKKDAFRQLRHLMGTAVDSLDVLEAESPFFAPEGRHVH